MNFQPTQLAVELNKDEAFEGLTSKQSQFVRAVFSGMSNVEAYRQTYDCSSLSPASLSAHATKLAREPLVTAKLRSMREEAERQLILAPSLTRDWIVNGLMHLALHGDRDSVRLGAYTQLGKTVGIDLFRETTRVERIERTPEQVEAELREHLARMTATIDGTSRPVASQPNPDPEPPRRQRRPRG